MKKSGLTTVLLIGIGLLPLITWSSMHLNQDAWWDEIISLNDFALTSFLETVTVYPDPNNHIFLNLIHNGISRIIGARDIYEMFDYLPVLRSMQLLIALGTILYSFLFVRRFISVKYSGLSVAMLASTIPFLNFSLQLRGYNLSMFFVAMLLYHGWSFLKTKNWVDGSLITLTTFSMLYTLPSNIYFLFAFGLIGMYQWILQIRSNRVRRRPVSSNKPIWRHSGFWLLILLLAGAVLAILAYWPVYEQLINNRFVIKTPKNRYSILTHDFPQILWYFLSNRYLMILVVLAGFYYLFSGRIKQNLLLYSILLLLLPFIFLTIHNKNPFQRTFIHLAPVFAILMTAFTAHLIEQLHWKNSYKAAAVLLFGVYLSATGIYEISRVDTSLSTCLRTGKKAQNIYYNYYLASDFQPHNEVRQLREKVKEKTPFILLHEMDRVSLMFYLEKYQFKSYSLIWLKKKKVKLKGTTFNHVGFILDSNGKHKEGRYSQAPALLYKRNKKYNEYLFLISAVKQMNRKKKYCLMTSDIRLTKQAYDKFLKNEFTIDSLGRSTYPYTYALTKK